MTDLDRTLGFVLHDVARLLRRRFDQRARELGLTRSQWWVMSHLARSEGCKQAELADALEVEPITLARHLDRLETAGLVERRACPADRRAWRLHLTAAGREVLTQLRRLGAETREEAMAGLDAAEREQLIDRLLTVKANVLKAIAGAEAGSPPHG
ncbi:MAG: MarR family transcriptional regulator [Magnetospirillum sp.]|nr:MarR family transcriptional regulator [Magnetospirillum sp.]